MSLAVRWHCQIRVARVAIWQRRNLQEKVMDKKSSVEEETQSHTDFLPLSPTYRVLSGGDGQISH